LLGHAGYRPYVLVLPLLTAVFLTMAVMLWNRGVKNYSSTGS
jgi:ABC-type uncharacterized transport system permease subunit